jgi:hypothetical protein
VRAVRVKAGIFSLTPPAPADDDGSYLRWHLLDHQPEQYQLPGMVYSLRWIADGAYLDARMAGNGPLAEIGNVVNYLIGDPVPETVRDFSRLGPRLAEVGRFPVVRPSLQISLLGLQQWYAASRALVSPEVVPFRPHRGVVVIVETPTGDDTPAWLQWLHAEHFPELLAAPGVAGAWMFGSTSPVHDARAGAGLPPPTGDREAVRNLGSGERWTADPRCRRWDLARGVRAAGGAVRGSRRSW